VNDRPTALELLAAVRGFLEREVVPRLDGPRRYHARVAAHVLAVVAREIETEEAQLRGEWERLGGLLGDPAAAPAAREALRDGVRRRNEELARRIRAGAADRGPWREAVIGHLRRTVADKLDVARPPRSGGPGGPGGGCAPATAGGEPG
jgi:hypothetical protein